MMLLESEQNKKWRYLAMLYKWKKELRKFHQDTDGSEVIEMVWTTMMLVCFIMIGLMLLTYVMQLTIVILQPRRLCVKLRSLVRLRNQR